MERCALGTRDPDLLVTFPEMVLAEACEKTRKGVRNISKKAMGVRAKTSFCLNNSGWDGHTPRLYSSFQLSQASEPRRSPGDLGIMPDITIPVSSKTRPTRRSRQPAGDSFPNPWSTVYGITS